MGSSPREDKEQCIWRHLTSGGSAILCDRKPSLPFKAKRSNVAAKE